jgi:hypothetical protein
MKTNEIWHIQILNIGVAQVAGYKQESIKTYLSFLLGV